MPDGQKTRGEMGERRQRGGFDPGSVEDDFKVIDLGQDEPEAEQVEGEEAEE